MVPAQPTVCLERCVIFTLKSQSSQSVNGQWSMETWHNTHIHTYPKLVKTFPFWVTVKFPEFSLTGKTFSRFSLTSSVAGNPELS